MANTLSKLVYSNYFITKNIDFVFAFKMIVICVEKVTEQLAVERNS